MNKTTYLICTIVAFVGWIVLQNMGSDLRWTALGVGIIMLGMAFITKDKVKPVEEELPKEEETDNLNKKGGNKNGI